ncbi:hypothetical protein PHK61_06815 [Actinomycetospora lutea]|uniref:hypothetical protein n=1 Tax=Actinomycetospora lutea TaxID=663604 RepID=UPI002365F5FB|nr:hypothetical protein [Actinomycetospora lutea]MDD7938127.1 hypothetical protein [Actinomycetospora lutea]
MEPHRTPAATVATVAAAALAAAGIVATMLLVSPGGIAAASVVVLTAVQVVLLLAVREGVVGVRRFLLAWTGQAGLTHLVAGGPGVTSALVYLGVGLVFAAVVVAGLALWRAEPEHDPDGEGRTGDTRPLPVPDGDG